jgi:hypothetical protein
MFNYIFQVNIYTGEEDPPVVQWSTQAIGVKKNIYLYFLTYLAHNWLATAHVFPSPSPI